MSRLRLLNAISVLAGLAVTVAACGGGSSGGSGGEDPQTVLDQTFSSHPSIKSGNLDLTLKVDVKQHGNEGGSVTTELSGPFETQGAGEVPKFDFDVTGGYDNLDPAVPESDFGFKGRLTSTGDAVYISPNLKGFDFLSGNFRIDPSQFALFKGALLAIPASPSLLTNLSNEGNAEVDGTPTTQVSGDLDLGAAPSVYKYVRSNANALKLVGLGFLGRSQLPPDSAIVAGLDPLINTATGDVYSGKQDHVLRRLTNHLSLNGVSVKTVDLNLDVKLSDLNKPQTIEAPPNPKPVSELVQRFFAFVAAAGD